MKICENLVTDYYSANFTEDETAWLVGSVFNNGDTIRDGHYIYKYAGVDGTNTDLKPSLSPTDWLKTATSNYYGMLGDRTNEKTSNAEAIIIEVDVNNFDTVALLGVEGTEVIIELTDLNVPEVVFTETFDLNNFQDIIDAYSYYFNPFEFFETYYQSLPIYANARLKITVNNPGSDAKIGRLVCGRSYDLGISLFGASFSLESYSRTEFDEFGTPTLVPREAVYNSSYSIKIPSQKIPTLQRKRKELDALPILFVGDKDDDSTYENLLSYGLWQDASIVLANPVKSDMNLTIKELI